MKHWLIATNWPLSRVLSMIRHPSPDGVTEGQQVWYDYAGKTDRDTVGTNSRPSLIARILPEGPSQFIHYARNNDWSKPTEITSTWSATGTNVSLRTIDLSYTGDDRNLKQVLGQNDELLLGISYSFDPVFPLTITNALNEVTTLTWNTNIGQIHTIERPGGLTTTNTYYFYTCKPADVWFY